MNRKWILLLLLGLAVVAFASMPWVIKMGQLTSSRPVYVDTCNVVRNWDGTLGCAVGHPGASWAGTLPILLAGFGGLCLVAVLPLAASTWSPRFWRNDWCRLGVMPFALIVAGVGLDYAGYLLFFNQLELQAVLSGLGWVTVWNLLVKVMMFLPASVLLLAGIVSSLRRRMFRPAVLPLLFLATILFLSWILMAFPFSLIPTT